MTIESRNEKILPDVKKITKVVDGKKQPLTEEETRKEIYKIFNSFYLKHLTLTGDYEVFSHLDDKFFTDKMCKRMIEYSTIFFDDVIKEIETGKRKIITTKERDIKEIKMSFSKLKRAIAKKRRELKKAQEKVAVSVQVG